MKFARVVDGKIYDICDGNPSEYFHPDVAQFYTEEIADDVEVGAEYNGSKWVNPLPIENILAYVAPLKLEPSIFMMTFTLSERLALKAAKSTDATVSDFFDIVDDQRLKEVDLAIPYYAQALDYFIENNFLQAERKAQILSGQLQ